MLDEQVLVVDIDPVHWTRLLSLFDRSWGEGNSTLFLIVEQQNCLKAIHSQKGAILNFDYGSGDLAALADREGVDFVARVGRDFLQKAFDAGQRDVPLDADYVDQMMTLYNGVIGFTSENMEWYPHRPRKLRPLDYLKAQKNFNRILPDGKTLFFCVTDNSLPYTSLILGKRSGHISLMTTLDAIGLAHTPFDTDADLPEVLDRIREQFDKVHLSFVIEKRCLEEMMAGSKPVTYLNASIDHGRALIHPLRFRLKVLLWVARVFKGL